MSDLLDSQTLRSIIRLQTEITRLGPDLGAVIDYVVLRLHDLSKGGAAMIEMIDGEERVVRAASGFLVGSLGMRFPIRPGGSAASLSIENGQTLICEDTESDLRVDRELSHRLGVRSFVVSPLQFHKIRVGIMTIASSEPGVFGLRDKEILVNISELVAAAMFHAARFEESDLYYKATHDVLTGADNRSLFHDQFRQRLALARRASSSFGLLCFDLDALKTINDTYGHRAGDAALHEVALRTMSVKRREETFARLGGDEFGLILNQVTSREDLQLAAARIARQVVGPFFFDGNELPLSISVGCAIYPEDGEDMDSLLDAADRDMYAQKRMRAQNP